jgi:hypothetical protein
MPLSPDLEARGLKAYEQARAFERLRSWRLPLTFAVFALVPALSGAWMWHLGHTAMAGLNFVAALFLAWMGRLQWKHLCVRYARNLRLLAELKAEYGDALPWIQVEKHFAALDQLKQELAENSRG